MKKFLFLILLVSCSLIEEIDCGWKNYIIYPGKHASYNRQINNNQEEDLVFDAIFLSGLYKFNDIDSLDWNKLFGVYQGNIHEDSYRFGWRIKQDNIIEICAYVYLDKVRQEPIILGETKLYQEDHYQILFLSAEVILIFNDQEARFPFSSNKPMKLSYPWFGGNKRAPTLISILLKHC